MSLSAIRALNWLAKASLQEIAEALSPEQVPQVWPAQDRLSVQGQAQVARAVGTMKVSDPGAA